MKADSAVPISNGSPRQGGLVEAPVQALGAGGDDLEVALQVVAVQRGDDQPAHPPPVVSLGREDPDLADFLGDLEDLAPAPEAVRPIAQGVVDGVDVGDHHDLPPAQVEAVEGPVALGPGLGGLVQPVGPQLMGVADQRQATGPGQVRDRAGRHRLAA